MEIAARIQQIQALLFGTFWTFFLDIFHPWLVELKDVGL